MWNTFWTRGLCPGCRKRWTVTQCPSCAQLSPHEAWYHRRWDEQPARVGRERKESADG